MPEEETDFDTILQRLDAADGKESEKETSPQTSDENSLPVTNMEAPARESAEQEKPDAVTPEVVSEGSEEPPVPSPAPESPFTGFFRQGEAMRHFEMSDEPEATPDLNDKAEPDLGEQVREPAGANSEAVPVEGFAEMNAPDAADTGALPSKELAAETCDAPTSNTIAESPLAVFAAEDSKQEELPPLSIRSRRKGPSLMPVLAGMCILLALAGAGFYLFRSQPDLLSTVLPGAVSRLAGLGKKGDADAGIRGVKGEFIANRETGEIFVISGEVVNISRKPLTAVQVRGAFYDNQGKVLLERTVYCGNVIKPREMAYQPFSSMEKKMKTQFGDGLANLDVPPGKGVPFMIVFREVPKGTRNFGAEVAKPAPAGP
jgi:hypothetical protein